MTCRCTAAGVVDPACAPAVRAETDDSRERCDCPPERRIETYGHWPHCPTLASPAARPAEVGAEPTGELREQIVRAIHHADIWIPEAERAADRVLSGPLAPLLAKLRAVEEITADLERTFRGSNIPVRLRRALDAS